MKIRAKAVGEGVHEDKEPKLSIKLMRSCPWRWRGNAIHEDVREREESQLFHEDVRKYEEPALLMKMSSGSVCVPLH